MVRQQPIEFRHSSATGRRDGARQPRQTSVKRWLRGPWLWVVLFAVLILVVLEAINSRNGAKDITTSEMVAHIDANDIKEITFVDGDQIVRATLLNGDDVQAHWLQEQGVKMLQDVQRTDTAAEYNVEVPQPSIIWTFISSFLPILLIILFFLFMMNSLQGGGGRVMQFAKSKAKMVSKDTPKTTFADVAGFDEAIEELGEIK